jgi:hypothetical protein
MSKKNKVWYYFHDDVKAFIETVPRGKRSNLVNSIIRAHMMITNNSNSEVIYAGGLSTWLRIFATHLRLVVDNLTKINQKIDKLSAKIGSKDLW